MSLWQILEGKNRKSMHSVLSRVTKVITFSLVALYHTSFDRVLHSREQVSHRAVRIYHPPAVQWDRQCVSINHQTWWILVTISAAYHKVEAQERRKKKSENRQTLLERSTSILQVYADNRKNWKYVMNLILNQYPDDIWHHTLHCHSWGKIYFINKPFSMLSKDTDMLWINI